MRVSPLLRIIWTAFVFVAGAVTAFAVPGASKALAGGCDDSGRGVCLATAPVRPTAEPLELSGFKVSKPAAKIASKPVASPAEAAAAEGGASSADVRRPKAPGPASLAGRVDASNSRGPMPAVPATQADSEDAGASMDAASGRDAVQSAATKDAAGKASAKSTAAKNAVPKDAAPLDLSQFKAAKARTKPSTPPAAAPSSAETIGIARVEAQPLPDIGALATATKGDASTTPVEPPRSLALPVVTASEAVAPVAPVPPVDAGAGQAAASVSAAQPLQASPQIAGQDAVPGVPGAAESVQPAPPIEPEVKIAADAAPAEAPAAETPATEAAKPPVKKNKAPRTEGPSKASQAAPSEPVPLDPAQVKLAEAPAELDGYKVNLNDMRPPAFKRTPPRGTPRTLSDTILSAISDNALIKAGEGTAAEALAAVGAASAALYPQLQGRIAVGPGGVSTWQAPRGSGAPYFDRKNTYGSTRGDLSVSGEQLIYDFGSTQSNVTKAAAGVEAQNWSVLSTTDEVAFKTATSYLKILEQRELLALAEENLTSLEEIANLVGENQKNGNGTVADVKRVGARVIDAASTKADSEYALKLASDDLRRLIQMDPGPLASPPTLGKYIPPDEVKALADALKTNPRLRSFRASIDARLAEIRSIKQGNLPKVVAEVSASNKQYQAVNDKTDLDVSAMLAVRYKFLDGGYASSQIEAVQARMFQDEMRMRDARETIESDLRRDYFTLKLSRGKTSSLAEGVDLNTKARSLYREQFRGGKRSLLELLEVQNAYYLSKRSQISNEFEERRANFSILRSMGRFAVTALTFR